MMMVEYLMGIWRTLVAQLEFFEMDDNATFSKYKLTVKEATDFEMKEPLRQCTSTWRAFESSPSDDTVVADVGLFTDELLECLEDLGLGGDTHECLKGADVEGGGPMATYTAQLMRIIGNYLTNMKRSHKNVIEFQTKVERKLEWVMMDHRMFHFQRPLPLLTPSMILEMGTCLKMISNSLSEASLPISSLISRILCHIIRHMAYFYPSLGMR